jgi:hypothetical protein
MSANRAQFVAAIGAPGSGKSLFIKSLIRRERPRRLLVWDAMNEYGAAAAPAPTLALLRQVTASSTFGRRFICSDNPRVRALQFDAFCQIAYDAGDAMMVVDELGDVTGPSPADTPAAWSTICRKGRHRGLLVVGGVQRPALVDKNFFGAATLIHCGRLNYEADVRTMANVLQVQAATVTALRPLDWIERDMQTGATKAGKIAIPAKKTARSAR